MLPKGSNTAPRWFPRGEGASQGGPRETTIHHKPKANRCSWHSRLFASDGRLRHEDGSKMAQESWPRRPRRARARAGLGPAAESCDVCCAGSLQSGPSAKREPTLFFPFWEGLPLSLPPTKRPPRRPKWPPRGFPRGDAVDEALGCVQAGLDGRAAGGVDRPSVSDWVAAAAAAR